MISKFEEILTMLVYFNPLPKALFKHPLKKKNNLMKKWSFLPFPEEGKDYQEKNLRVCG